MERYDVSAKILLVEDDREQAILYAQVLEASGYDVVVTESAEEAQARMTAEAFDLLLADWDLGAGMMTGDTLIVWAKAHDPTIKTILFSNHFEVLDLVKACGADAAFRKVEGILPLRRLVSELVPPDAGHA